MLRLPAMLLECITQIRETLSDSARHREFCCPPPLLGGDPFSISLQTVSRYKGLHATLSKCCPFGLLCVRDSGGCIFFLDQPANPANSLQDCNRHFTKWEMILNKHIKRYSYLYSLGKCKLKPRWDTTTYPLNKKGWHSPVVVKTRNEMTQLLWQRVCQFLIKLNTM